MNFASTRHTHLIVTTQFHAQVRRRCQQCDQQQQSESKCLAHHIFCGWFTDPNSCAPWLRLAHVFGWSLNNTLYEQPQTSISHLLSRGAANQHTAWDCGRNVRRLQLKEMYTQTHIRNASIKPSRKYDAKMSRRFFLAASDEEVETEHIYDCKVN